jgi:hypothetical protein
MEEEWQARHATKHDKASREARLKGEQDFERDSLGDGRINKEASL